MPIIAEASTLEWQGIIDALTTEFTVSSIASVLSLTITACVGLVFAWWGMRKGENGSDT